MCWLVGWMAGWLTSGRMDGRTAHRAVVKEGPTYFNVKLRQHSPFMRLSNPPRTRRRGVNWVRVPFTPMARYKAGQK